MMDRPRGDSGFTLLELITTMAIAAIILAIAVPNFREFAANNRMTGTANDLLAATHAARTEAIKRHVQTVFCFANDPLGNAPECDGTPADGWIVFVDDADPAVTAAGDNNLEVDTNEAILLRHGPMHDSVSVRSNPSGNIGYVAYNAAGFLREIPTIGTAVDSLVLCDHRGNNALYGPAQSTARGFVVSPTGRPSVTRTVADITTLGGCP